MNKKLTPLSKLIITIIIVAAIFGLYKVTKNSGILDKAATVSERTFKK